jgi:hypothetical protein
MTMVPNAEMAELHDRMPVVVEPQVSCCRKPGSDSLSVQALVL